MKVVQIGSNVGKDGIIIDLLSDETATALMVEPNPKALAALKKNYKDHRSKIIFENVAISDFSGSANLYIDNYETEGCSEHSSLNSNFQLGVRENVIPLEVQCITLTELFEKHKIDHAEWLVIDTEGYDAKIILSTDFNKINVDNILFEHSHTDGLNTVGKTYIEIIKHLNKCDYFNVRIVGKRDTLVKKKKKII